MKVIYFIGKFESHIKIEKKPRLPVGFQNRFSVFFYKISLLYMHFVLARKYVY